MQGPWASCCPGPLLVSFGPSPLFFLGEENNDLFATTPDLLKKKEKCPLYAKSFAANAFFSDGTCLQRRTHVHLETYIGRLLPLELFPLFLGLTLDSLNSLFRLNLRHTTLSIHEHVLHVLNIYIYNKHTRTHTHLQVGQAPAPLVEAGLVR
jgi:hypothetical protein